MYGRVVASTTELRGFVREAVGDVYRYALALTVSPSRAEQLTTSAAVRLARHVDAVGAAPVSTARLNLVVRREVLDSLPRRRRLGRRTRGQATSDHAPIRASAALDALASLDVDERVALVLRHYDGLLLPDVAAALGVPYPEAEKTLNRARARLAGTIERFDDGTGADPYGRLVRGVPGPPDALADRVWVTVDAALVPDYANGDASWSDAWSGRHIPDGVDGDDPLGWEGFDAVPVQETHIPPAREARRVGTTLLVGAGALAVVLGVAALTAPSEDPGQLGNESSIAPEPSASDRPEAAVPAESAPLPSGPGTRGLQPPAEPDLVIDPNAVGPHQPDRVDPLSDAAIGPRPPRQADVAVRVRFRDGTSQVVVRRVASDGASEVWLVSVAGEVRKSSSDDPDLLQSWAVDGGSVVLALRVAGSPDTQVLVGLRPGGAGTWLRLADGAEPQHARLDGSVVCLERSSSGRLGVSTYQVLR